MPISRYCVIFPHPDDRSLAVLFSTRTVATLVVPLEMISDIKQGTVRDDEKETLVTHGIIVESLEHELLEMQGYIDEMNRLNKAFSAIVVMSLDCNLACGYCFEGTRKGKHYLSEETAHDLVDFIIANAEGRDEIDLAFYGGEPLLSTDMIIRISDEISSRAHQHGIKYGFSLITNGTLLTRRVVEQLKSVGLRSARVTLDGPRLVHDRSRPFRSGTGSFDTIVRNLHDSRGLIEIHANGNFTRSNYREFPALLDFLDGHGLGPDHIASIGFFPAFNEAARLSPDFHDGCSSSSEPWVADAGIFLREEILSRGYRTEEVHPSVCMIERSGHLVINYDGSLYKCPGLIERKEFCAGTVKTDLPYYANAYNLGHWKNGECLACSYLPLCFGGCRYLKFLRDGNMNGLDCRKEYFDRTLEPLVLQDVKYMRWDIPKA